MPSNQPAGALFLGLLYYFFRHSSRAETGFSQILQNHENLKQGPGFLLQSKRQQHADLERQRNQQAGCRPCHTISHRLLLGVVRQRLPALKTEPEQDANESDTQIYQIESEIHIIFPKRGHKFSDQFNCHGGAVDCNVHQNGREQGVVPCVDLSHEDSHQKAQQELRRIAVRQTKGKRTDQDAEPNTDTGERLHQEASVEQLLRQRCQNTGIQNGHQHGLSAGEIGEIRIHAGQTALLQKPGQCRIQIGCDTLQPDSDGDVLQGAFPREILRLEQTAQRNSHALTADARCGGVDGEKNQPVDCDENGGVGEIVRGGIPFHVVAHLEHPRDQKHQSKGEELGNQIAEQDTQS